MSKARYRVSFIHLLDLRFCPYVLRLKSPYENSPSSKLHSRSWSIWCLSPPPKPASQIVSMEDTTESTASDDDQEDKSMMGFGCWGIGGMGKMR